MIPAALTILSALLLSLSFASFNLWPLAWCAFVPLFIALENKSLRFCLLAGFFCGLIFWSLCLWWLIHVTLLGQIVLIFYLAVYFSLFSGVIYFARFLSPKNRLFFLPVSWVLLEYLRSYLFTGLPWALAGFSQYKILPVIQIADITGAWGVSFLIVLGNAALYLFLRKPKGTKILLVPSLILLLSLGYGFIKLSYKPQGGNAQDRFKISVIQGNISQDLKWDKRQVDFIQDRYEELTLAAAADKPELIIWPEAAVPGLWGRDDAQFARVFSLAAKLRTNLLAGAVSYDHENYFNSALLINPAGPAQEIYHKLHRVPFGEYIPLKNIFPFLETIAPIGDIQPGKKYTIFRQPADFGVLICFEDLFPELSREFVKKGARFLVNITNDAWYKESSAPYQHFAASVFRAVENRVYLARAANTGISGFIDPAGRVLGLVKDGAGKEIFVQGSLCREICLAGPQRTIYNRFGDFFIGFCLLFDAWVAIILFRSKKKG
jgi:apolipoprotein N-acyltransferase